MTGDPAPLAQLVGRALRSEVSELRSELLSREGGVELERVRFVQYRRERSLVFKRVPRDDALEVDLLPFLGRKTDRVPEVHARGIPPPMVPAPRWLLMEDLAGAPTACDADVRTILDAKLEIERAVAKDGPALRALGVRTMAPLDLAQRIAAACGQGETADEALRAARRLAKWPLALVHGDLRCRSAVLAERGAVIVDWGRAYIGCALLDVARLVRDVVGRGEAVLAIALPRTYAERLGLILPTEILRAAEKLDVLSERYAETGL